MHAHHRRSPIGPLTLVACNGALTGVHLAEHLHRPARAALGQRVSIGLGEATEQLEQYFAGEPTGYAGGLDRKRFLLELESLTTARPGRLFWPGPRMDRVDHESEK